MQRQDISVINRLCMLHISYGKRANLTLEKSINGSFRLIMWYQASNSYAYAQSVLADVFQGCRFNQLRSSLRHYLLQPFFNRYDMIDDTPRLKLICD